MKRYCASCGSPTEYTIKKPLFCSSCAKPFDKIEEKDAKPVVQKVLMQKKTIANKKYIEDMLAHYEKFKAPKRLAKTEKVAKFKGKEGGSSRGHRTTRKIPRT